LDEGGPGDAVAAALLAFEDNAAFRERQLTVGKGNEVASRGLRDLMAAVAVW